MLAQSGAIGDKLAFLRQRPGTGGDEIDSYGR